MFKNLTLTKKIFIAIVIGIICGLILQQVPEGFVKNDLLLGGILRFLGQGFVRFIQMLVVPLVFVSLIVGSSSLGDVKKIGRIGGKTIMFFLATTMFAIILALVVAHIINPGLGLDMSHLMVSEPTINEPAPLVDTFLNMIPQNPVRSMANGEMLPIIVFALMIGVAIAQIKDKVEIVANWFEQLDTLFNKIVMMVMELAPIGVFALITTTFATVGFDAFIPLAKYMITVLLVLALHAIFVYGGILTFLGRVSLPKFLKKFAPVAAVAFSTSSSNATLPVTMEEMEKAGVDNKIASFVLPLGATINMDGTAIMQGAAVVFISQVYGIELGMGGLLTVVLTATLASIGTAGVPGVGLITLSMVLTSVGLPVEGIGLIMGIDRILDMSRTMVNVMGDAVASVVIGQSEGGFNKEKMYAEKVKSSEPVMAAGE